MKRKKRNKAVFIPDGTEEGKGEYGTLGKEYDAPLLKTLIDFGGEGKACEVIEEVGKEMDLKEVDYEELNSGEIVWKNNVRWASDRLKKVGLLDKLRGGIWRITEEGRNYYKDENGKTKMRGKGSKSGIEI